MKNIHILPTDKPSRLFDDGIEFYLGELKDRKGHPATSYNIYITSDEEIKDGDYYIHGGRLHKHLGKKCIDVLTNKEYPQSRFINKDSVFKKIILTTDQDLIKDGIQAINDEFLEWFVKNPSCEKVKVKPLLSNNGRALFGYKIIIPKEEPKKEPVLKCDLCKTYPRLEGTNKCESCYSVVRHFLEQDPEFKGKLLPDLRKKQETLEESLPKNRWKYTGNQETIEEAAREYYKRGQLGFEKAADTEMAFLKGVKWQQERSYNEEEVLDIIENAFQSSLLTNKKISILEWFEQFKKK